MNLEITMSKAELNVIDAGLLLLPWDGKAWKHKSDIKDFEWIYAKSGVTVWLDHNKDMLYAREVKMVPSVWSLPAHEATELIRKKKFKTGIKYEME